MHRYMLVSAYLTRQEAMLAYFERLDAHLAPLGYRLFLVNTGNAPITSTVENITLPAYVTLAQILPGKPFIQGETLSPQQQEGAAAEACRRGLSESTATLKVLLYTEAMREIMLRIRPALVLLWLQFDGLHRALDGLCGQWGVPRLFAEYGSLPGTVVYEAEGQMAESPVARDSQRFAALPVSDEELERAKTLLERLRVERHTRRPAGDENKVQALASRARAEGRRVLFYAGQNDPMSGMLPRSLPNARLHSPHFESTLDALDALLHLAEKRNWHVLFKPHPMMEKAHTRFMRPLPERCTLIPGANIFDAIAHSDVTVTILSQVSYLALIHKKPCVLLGRNQLTGKACLYEPEDRDDMGDCINRACAEGFSASQQSAFVRHAAQMCRYNLFSFTETLRELVGRGEKETANFLASQVDGHSFPETTGAIASHSTAFRGLYAMLRGVEPLLTRGITLFEGPLLAWYRR